jgi:hypothetical protein
MAIESQLIEDEIYLVTNRVEEDRGYIYNRRNGEHIFSRQMGSVYFIKQIFVKAEKGNLEIDKIEESKNFWGGKTPRKVKITGKYLVGALNESTSPAEYRRLLQIWRTKRNDSQ